MEALITEQDIVNAMDGDNTAFTRLINHTRNTISSIALAIVKDIDASEEVTQQVYIQCWQKLHTLQNPASFLPWLRQSTRYAAFNYLRDNKVNSRIGGEEADRLFAEFCAQDDLAEEALSRDQQNAIMAKVIDDLPEETREIVLLYYREEQSSSQVAKLLSISSDNVRQQLSRARLKLRSQLLEKYGSLILATAPTLAISATLIVGSSVSVPAHAASSGMAKTTFWGGIKWLLSGAMIAAVVGAIAVYLSAELPIRRMQDAQRKAMLRKERKRTVIATLLSGILLAAAYEFTQGWIGPIIAYEIFMGIVFVQTRKMQNMIAADKGCGTKGQRLGRWSLYGAIVVGNLALLYGLQASGRPFF